MDLQSRDSSFPRSIPEIKAKWSNTSRKKKYIGLSVCLGVILLIIIIAVAAGGGSDDNGPVTPPGPPPSPPIVAYNPYSVDESTVGVTNF